MTLRLALTALLLAACAPEPAPVGGCPVAYPAHASYLAGTCLLACERSWVDCNGDVFDGCEASVAADATCGTCDRQCGAGLSCQLLPGTTATYRCWTR